MNRTLELFLLSSNLTVGLALLFLIPKRKKQLAGNSSVSRQVVMDSCALIDGRIVDLAEAGFTPEIVVIPSFIIRELQLLADGGDSHKRERARFGLDTANRLKELKGIEVIIDRTEVEAKTTDDKLIALTQKTGAQLYTTDFNLAKVALVEGVKVLNVNELAQKLKPNFLPGETMKIKVVQKGSSRGQGVGYTDDGTMVVVDKADRMVGKTLDVVVDRMIGTLAGKMIFAKIPNRPKPNRSVTVQKRVENDDEVFVSDLRSELNR